MHSLASCCSSSPLIIAVVHSSPPHSLPIVVIPPHSHSLLLLLFDYPSSLASPCSHSLLFLAKVTAMATARWLVMLAGNFAVAIVQLIKLSAQIGKLLHTLL